MIGAAHRHGGQPCRGDGGNFIRFFQQHGQGARPEGVHQLFRRFRHFAQALKLASVRYVHDQRIVRRAFLGGENGAHGGFIQGVCP